MKDFEFIDQCRVTLGVDFEYLPAGFPPEYLVEHPAQVSARPTVGRSEHHEGSACHISDTRMEVVLIESWEG